MYYFSKSVTMGMDDAVWATKEALKRHNFRVLAEIDMRIAFKRHLAVDFHPYLILSACSPQLTHRAIRADDEIGSIVLCNVVIQQRNDGHVKISVADPAGSIGTINHVELIGVARDLRSLLQRAIDEVEYWPKSRSVLPGREEAARERVHALA
jgi:uncharacterized protein (DUF302 family)